MLEFSESATISGEPAAIWQVVSDAASWHEWDPHLEQVGFDGRFEVGATGWTKPKGAPRGTFTLVAIEPQRGYTTNSPMPFGGKMLITNSYQPDGAGRMVVSRHVEVHGVFSPVFKTFFMKAMRRDMHATFSALEQEAQLRSSSADA